MKFNFLLILFATILVQGLQAQMNVALHMHQKLNDQPFVLNSTATAPGDYAIRVSRMQYYISEVKLVHDGGQLTPVTDLHLLVTAQLDSIFELGNFNVTNIEGIEFSIGVDQAHNHLDPASYPADHPLAPKNPTMHWGWAAGYRFICFEGKSSNNGGTSFPDVFQIHTVDDTNYKPVFVPVTGIVEGDQISIHIDADYTKLLTDLNAQGGLISHAANGPSADIVVNMQNHVFTPSALVSGTVVPDVVGSFSISPNPASGSAIIRFEFPGFNQLALTVSDLSGRIVFEQQLDGAAQNLLLPVDQLAGMYIVTVRSGERIIAQEKLVVSHH